jgi:hypothetical protein
MLCRLGRVNEAAAVCERAEALARAHGENEILTALQAHVRIELDIMFANPATAHDHAGCALEAGEKVGTPTARMNGLWALGTAHRLNAVNHHPKITPRYQLKFPPPCVLFEQAASATMPPP